MNSSVNLSIKSLSDLKAVLKLGTKVKLVKHDWLHPNAPLKVGTVREVTRVQTNAVQFGGGSWLHLPKASGCIFNNDNTFSIKLRDEPLEVMTYEVVS